MIKRLSFFIILAVFVLSCSSAFAKAQDIIKMNTDIEISKDMVAGDVVAIGGNITVFGRVENNIVAIGGSVLLKPRSYVGEQVVIVGGDVIKEPLAVVEGRITQIYLPKTIPCLTTFLKGGWISLWITVSTLVFFGFLGLAILLTALIPEHIGTAIRALELSFPKMLLWGILWMVLIVPIAVLLAISIIGIILIPLEILLVALALMIGYIVSAVFIGKKILAAFKKPSLPFVDAILGIIVLFLIGFIPVIGTVVKAFFLMAGFGAVLTTRFGTMK